MNQKLRSEISDDYKWDLTSIYENDKLFEEDLLKVKEKINNLEQYKKNIIDSADNLYECLNLEHECARKLDKLYMYAHLTHDEDTTSILGQEMVGKVQNLYKLFDEATSFIRPTLLKNDYNKIEEYYKENEKLKEYQIVLQDIFRYKEHTLSEKEEEIVSKLNKSLQSSSSTYESLTDSDMSYGCIKDENGNDVELTDSNYSKFLKSDDRRVRKDAFDKIYETYAKYKNTITSTYIGDIEVNTTIANIYNYKSALEASLFNDNIDRKVYDNLIDTVSKNLDVLYRYYNIKKETLKLDQLHLYDTYVSVIENSNKEYTFDEARELVKQALNILGNDYVNDLDKAFNDKWIDIYNNKGKRSGAYSSGSYDTNPYLLLNYEGTLNDISTLAHELGHSLHSYYSRINNSYQNSNYKIFVAEVASTVNELLLAFHQLNKSTDKQEKLTILNGLLDLFKSTIYRQTMFAEFEREMYKKHENGEVLTYEVLCESYYNLNKKYFGENVVVDEYIKYEWERIPHFYYNFYVYKYATSLSASCYIVDSILENKNNMKEKYLKFLTLGGSMYPLDEFKTMGIDMTDEQVVSSAIKTFEKLLSQFEDLLKD